MNQPARLLAEEIKEDRPLPLAHVGETSDPSETPQPPGRHDELARLLSQGGGLDEPVDAEHERDGSGPAEGGKESGRMIGPINAFAPRDTFAAEARYLVARTGCVAKMERVLTCWWLRGLRIMLVGDTMLRDYPSWAHPLLHLGAEFLLADWNAQPEADKRSCGNEAHGQNCELAVVDTCWWLPGLTLMRMGDLHGRHYSSGAAILRSGIDLFIAAWKARCEEERSREGMGVAQTAEVRLFERSSGVVDTHEPSVTGAPGLMAESPRVETPTRAVAASRAECTPSLAAAAPRAEGAPVLAAETSRPEWTPSQATDAPVVVVEAARTEDPPAMVVEAPRAEEMPVLAVDAPRAERAAVLAVEAPCIDEGGLVLAVDPPCIGEAQCYAVVRPPRQACDAGKGVACTPPPPGTARRNALVYGDAVPLDLRTVAEITDEDVRQWNDHLRAPDVSCVPRPPCPRRCRERAHAAATGGGMPVTNDPRALGGAAGAGEEDDSGLPLRGTGLAALRLAGLAQRLGEAGEAADHLVRADEGGLVEGVVDGPARGSQPDATARPRTSARGMDPQRTVPPLREQHRGRRWLRQWQSGRQRARTRTQVPTSVSRRRRPSSPTSARGTSSPTWSTNPIRSSTSLRGALSTRPNSDPFLDLARWGAVRTFDAIPAEIIAERVFADGGEAIVDDFDDGQPDEGDWYVARLALGAAESEVKFVETLNERRKGVGDGRVDDPAMVASLQRVARTAWSHTYRARAEAAQAEGDPVIGPLAARAVARAHRAARAIAGAAARAVTRAAVRARNSARARIGRPAPLSRMRRRVSPSARPRAPHARRVRVSAVAGAGSGSDEPSPEPSGAQHGTPHAAQRSHTSDRYESRCSAASYCQSAADLLGLTAAALRQSLDRRAVRTSDGGARYYEREMVRRGLVSGVHRPAGGRR